jgi:hypothetical protein
VCFIFATSISKFDQFEFSSVDQTITATHIL